MRHVPEGVDAFAAVAEAHADGGKELVGEVGQSPPVSRGLEGVDGVAGVPQCVAQIRRPKAVPPPCLAEDRQRDAAVSTRRCLLACGVRRSMGAGRANEKQAEARGGAAARPHMCGARDRAWAVGEGERRGRLRGSRRGPSRRPGRTWASSRAAPIEARPGAMREASRVDLGRGHGSQDDLGEDAQSPSEPRTSWRRSGPAAEAGWVGIASVPDGASMRRRRGPRCAWPRLRWPDERRDPAADGAQLPRLRLVTEGEATPGERPRAGPAVPAPTVARPLLLSRSRRPASPARSTVSTGRSPSARVTPPTTLVPPPNGSPRRPPRPHRRGGRGPGHRPQARPTRPALPAAPRAKRDPVGQALAASMTQAVFGLRADEVVRREPAGRDVRDDLRAPRPAVAGEGVPARPRGGAGRPGRCAPRCPPRPSHSSAASRYRARAVQAPRGRRSAVEKRALSCRHEGRRVEVVVDTGDGTQTFDRRHAAGRRLEVTTARGVVEVTEVTRGGNPVRTGRFMASRVVALVEHPAHESDTARVEVEVRRRISPIDARRERRAATPTSSPSSARSARPTTRPDPVLSDRWPGQRRPPRIRIGNTPAASRSMRRRRGRDLAGLEERAASIRAHLRARLAGRGARRTRSQSGVPRQAQSTVRSLGTAEKQTPWSTP